MKRFSFKSVGLKAGDQLTFVNDPKIIAIIVDDNFVDLAGERLSTSGAALKVLENKGLRRISVRGPSMWKFNGLTLNELAERKI